MFKKLFGSSNKAESASKLAAVRNITVGRTVSLDPLAWRRLGEETRFALDRDVLDISAQGLIRLESGQFVHRFYTDDHVMLQAMSDDEAGHDQQRSEAPRAARGNGHRLGQRAPVVREDREGQVRRVVRIKRRRAEHL